jgi:hypothetical protein
MMTLLTELAAGNLVMACTRLLAHLNSTVPSLDSGLPPTARITSPGCSTPAQGEAAPTSVSRMPAQGGGHSQDAVVSAG